MHKFVIITVLIFSIFNVAQATPVQKYHPPVIPGFDDYVFQCGIGSNPEILLIKDNKGHVGLVDANGNILIPFKYSEGGCRHVYVNIKKTKYVNLHYFALKNKQGKWGLLNELNQTVVPFEYDHLDNPYGSSDLFIVKKNEKYGVIQINNDVPVPFDYSLIVPFEYDSIKGHAVYGVSKAFGKYLIVQKGEQVGLLTGNGSVRVPVKYEKLEDIFSIDDYMRFQENNKWGLVSIVTGEVIIPALYEREHIKKIEEMLDFFRSVAYRLRLKFNEKLKHAYCHL